MFNFLMSQPQAADGSSTNSIFGFLPIILIFVFFYLFMILPQQKKQKKLREMIDNLAKGDKVMTTGGIIGQVIGSSEDIIVIKSGETKLEINKAFIAQKVEDSIKTN